MTTRRKTLSTAVGAFGKSAAILFQLQKGPAPLAEVEFDLQQFPQQPIALAGRGLEQNLLDQRRFAGLARLFELVAHLVDAAGRGDLRLRRVVASLLAHGGGVRRIGDLLVSYQAGGEGGRGGEWPERARRT